MREERTPRRSQKKKRESLIEEYSDVVNCNEELRIAADRNVIFAKRERFMKRWNTAHPDGDKEK